MANKQSEVRHYFIDEGGDSTLFSRGGRVLIGSKGCSRFFVPGLLDVPDPMALQYSLEDLRKQLLGNPYFRDVPSMQAEKRKTARSQFAQKHGIAIGASLQVFEFSPSEQAGLQAVDYFTWAIQRLYERHEERYVRYLGEAVRVVLDIDDKRKTGAGKYYTRKSPIRAARLAWRHEKEKPGI